MMSNNIGDEENKASSEQVDLFAGIEMLL